MDEPIPLLEGIKLKGWDVTKRLGYGAYGSVYKLEKDREIVVMKVPIVPTRADFSGEAMLMYRIQDASNVEDRTTHICRLLEYGKLDIPDFNLKGIEYLMQEFCPNNIIIEMGTNNDIDAIPMYEAEAKQMATEVQIDELGKMAFISCQILRAVWDLHQAGILNRDIKQENIGLPTKVKIYDFGLAMIYSKPDGSHYLPKANVDLCGTTEWCSFKAEYGYDQGRIDDLWGWFLTTNEMYFCYSGIPQAWSCQKGYEMDPALRLLLKAAGPGELWMPYAHANMHRIRFYLETVGQTDTPNYFLLAQMANEMRVITKKRNKPAVSNCEDVLDHLHLMGNYFF